jgi:restriction system-associated AAA family ATPase
MQPVYKLIGIEGIDRFELTIRQDLHVPKAPLKKTLMVYDDLLRARSASDEGKSFELTSLAIEWIDKLHRCATAIEDRHKKAGASPGLTLKFSIDEEARRKFRHEFANDPLELFRVFQILLTLNLFDVDVRTKQYIYRSSSLYVGESVPALAHFQRVSNFNDVMLWKIGIDGVPHKIPLRALSDGEFQLLHSLGICLLLKDTNALFLLDEPETHFNPDWRARFISTLQACLQTNGTTESGSEMLITTHSPFLVSDTPRDNVLIFKAGQTEPNRPDFQSYGASADDITMQIFEREQTIGEGVYALLNEWRAEPIHSHADIERLRANTAQIGDSVEKIMFLNYLREQSKKLPVQSML